MIFLSSLLSLMLNLSRFLLKGFVNSVIFVVAAETSFISLVKCFCRADLTVNLLLHGCQNCYLCRSLIKLPGHNINVHLRTFTLPGLFYSVNEKQVLLVFTDAMASKAFSFHLATNIMNLTDPEGLQ